MARERPNMSGCMLCGPGSASNRFWAPATQQRRQAVLKIALEHQLISPYTSLVAVEQRPARSKDASLQGGDLPVSLPAG
ncbi:MAG: hypothetical protein P8163_04810 [Candidatus Thiodiazotropha sp.]